jgi:hypothetical protein
MTLLKQGAAALASVAALFAATSPAQAQQGQAKPASAFIQCDGRTGHVDGGERFLRLLLVSATAGLSETGMSRDDASKRARGAAGVAACDQALASEGDAYRRVQLALARALHFAEDKKWEEAAAAAHAVPQQLGDKAGDWGLAKGATSTARYLEALFLIRAGKVDAGEAAAWDGIRTGGIDVITMQRMARYTGLSRTISPEKRAALLLMQRYLPDTSIRVANTFAEGGDYASAAASIRGLDSIIRAFAKEPAALSGIHSQLATYAAMSGDLATARSEYTIAKDALERDRSEGDAASRPTDFARDEEELAFAEAAIAAAAGDSAQAARLLAARGSWPNSPPGLVARLVGRVAPVVPEKDRMGVVAKGEDTLWREALDARLAVLNRTDADPRLWGVTALLTQDIGYQRLARNAATGSSAKPKWLVRPGKEPRTFDLIAAGVNAQGWEAGEGILYHAALIARARGKQGFILFPKRTNIDIVGLRFVNAGEFGIPAGSMVMADEVINALSPHLTAAPTR